jgi:uncharacterized membrane-anchored protein
VQVLANGEQIILRTMPVDPRSLFRGDYVRLRYEITRLAGDQVSFEVDDFRAGQTVYVKLKPDQEAWTAASVHGERPAQSGDYRVIRGRIASSRMEEFFPGRRGQDGKWIRSPRETPVRMLTLYYGIEAYFVPEGTGRTLERPADDQLVSIRIALDDAGKAAISGVLLDGKLVHEESLF